jgi:hypothetical protein
MRPRIYILLLITTMLVMRTRQIEAQIFEVSAGASTSYGAEGGSLTIHGEQTESVFGGGFIQHRFAAGGSTTRIIPHGTETAGQQQFSMDLPTDVFNTSHMLFGVGAGEKLLLANGQKLNLFAGVLSQEGGTPLFQTATLAKPLLYGSWIRPIGKSCSSVTNLLFSSKSAALQSIQCHRSPALRYAATIGFGANAPYAAASFELKERRLNVKASYIYAGDTFQRVSTAGDWTPEPVRDNVSADYKVTSSLTVSGMHQHFLSPASTTSLSQTMAIHSELDSAALQYQSHGVGVGITYLHSSSEEPAQPSLDESNGSDQAGSINFRDTFGRFQWTETLMHTFRSSSAASSILVNGLSVAVNPHIRLTEHANVTSNGTTFSHGGALYTSVSSFELDYEFFYLATQPQHPFQQAMVFDAQVRLPRNLALHASSNIGSTGKPEYTIQLSTLFVRNTTSAQPAARNFLGLNTARGRVVDTAGSPVEGAALMIGSERIYTDSEGYFFFREKHPGSRPLRVLTDEFLAMGNYVTRTAPAQIKTHSGSSDDLVMIVVDHGATPTHTSNLSVSSSSPIGTPQ